MPPAPPLRRADDARFDELRDEVGGIKKVVGEIRDMLISEPEASPLGRQLLRRSDGNKALIDEQGVRLDSLEASRDEFRGSWRVILAVGVVLSIIGSFFGIASYFGIHP